jgi:hypothetical protein
MVVVLNPGFNIHVSASLMLLSVVVTLPLYEFWDLIHVVDTAPINLKKKRSPVDVK